MQQMVYERTIYAPIWQLAFINGVGPRVGESGFGLIAALPLHRALRGHHAQRAHSTRRSSRDSRARIWPTLAQGSTARGRPNGGGRWAHLPASQETRDRRRTRSELTRRELLALAALGLVAGAPRLGRRGRRPQGQLTWGIHVSLAPTWFDPAETPGIITPFMVLYALHDAMVKPMPGKPLAPSLAESWSASEDGLTYDFVLRQGAKFHNGEPVTAEDVKFSFERYRGASHDLMKDAGGGDRDPRSAACPLQAEGAVARLSDLLRERHRRRLDRAEEIRREGRRRRVQEGADRRRPLQIRLVHARASSWCFEAFDQYWRKTPSVKRLVFKVDPRRVDAAGRAEARRGRHRLFDPRRTCRGAAAHAGADPEAGRLAGARSGSISPTSGTRNRRGTTSGCGRRPISRSTARRSTRR